MTTLQVNRPPAITWYRLRANNAEVDLPLALASAAVAVDVPAFSQVSALGAAADEWLCANATRYERVSDDATVEVEATPGATEVAVIDVVAAAGERVRVLVHADAAPGAHAEPGAVCVLVRVEAGPGAHVELTMLQTLGLADTYVEGIAIAQAAGATVNVGQTVLGGARSYVGSGADMAGDEGASAFDVHYLGQGTSLLDFNYAISQRGVRTTCDFTANGVLTGESRKVMRDTIDFVHGCKGSVGREAETVLLASDGVSNISLPVLLCDEDDVQGDHGATIGHVEASQMEYLQSRGLDLDQIEALFLGAVFDYAAANAPSERGLVGINRVSRAVIGRAAGARDDADEEE